MPQEPKRRHSRERKGKRRHGLSVSTPKTGICPNCQGPILPHSICRTCGFYKGKNVLRIKNKNDNKTDEKSS